MNSNQKQKNAAENKSKKKSAIFSRHAFREAIDKISLILIAFLYDVYILPVVVNPPM
jgi:hypothetical protein